MDAIAGSALAPGSVSTPPDRYSELSTDEFIKILFTELSNQDPMQPNDSAALLEQISSIRSIQSDIDLGRRMESLISQNELSAAGTLIGTTVRGLDESNQRVEGVVQSVFRTPDGPVLNLGAGIRLPFGRVDEVRAAAGGQS